MTRRCRTRASTSDPPFAPDCPHGNDRWRAQGLVGRRSYQFSSVGCDKSVGTNRSKRTAQDSWARALAPLVHSVHRLPKRGRVSHLFWTLLLAGGRGSRLNTVTGGVPKQFWSPDGKHAMVERTLARLGTMAAPSRTVTVIGPDQRQYLGALGSVEALGTVLEQPADRGTGVAVLWGLCEILTRDPRAVVMLTPADHAVDSEPEYREGVRLAVRAVAERWLSPVLFGVTPSRPAPDYGWIVPAASGDAGDQRLFRNVMAFAEKPTGPEAARLMSLGSLWNTMVLVGRA